MFDSLDRLLLGLLTGIVFGVLLQKGRVAKFSVIVGQFILKDWTVVKLMVTAVLVGSVGVYALVASGQAELHVKPFLLAGVLLGGICFGVGMAVSGYCPGTGVAACGEGKPDAMVGVLGMLAGALAFVAAWPALQPVIKGLGDMGQITLPGVTGTSPWLWIAGLLSAGLIAFVIFARRSNPPSSQIEPSSPASTSARRSKSRVSRLPSGYMALQSRLCVGKHPVQIQHNLEESIMTKLRREFITESGSIGLGSVVLASGTLSAANAKPSAADAEPNAADAEPNAADAKSPAAPPASMIFETVLTEGVAELSYLIGDKATGKAAVIDPRRDIDIYVELARKHKLTITHTLETHIHADLVSGCLELANRTETAKVCVSAEGDPKYGFPHEKLKDGDTIDLGRVILTAKHTPGHTPEHMSYLASESNHPEQPFAIFSGDCLFANSVGRPDLLGDEQTGGLAKQLYKSIYDFFLKLPDDVRVHPAHGAGSPCGANISDRLVTTIGYERKNNPALQFKEEAKFIEYVLFTAPPEPVYYPRMKKENAEGPAVLERLPTCPPMTPRDFEQAVGNGDVQLIDNRQMLSFGGGHIAGALNIGPRAELSIWAGWMLDPKKPIFLVLPKDTDLPEVQQQFIRVGYYKFGGYLLGGMEEWNNKGLPITAMAQMSVHELKAALPPKDLQILDVRTPGERQDGHIPGSTYIFLPELEKKAKRLDKSKPVAVYCDSGYRASLAASLLLRMGFEDVRNVPGSWKAWKALKYEVQMPKERKKGTDTDLS